ncbi:MAG: hypothetical protein H6Q07_2065 [Acidobacteria bacterium]|nr:hypothetical protein [Acidobacteriota bacterium]
MNIGRLAALSVMLLLPAFAAAQASSTEKQEPSWNARPRFEITSSVSATRVFRVLGSNFGTHPNFGVGMEVAVWKKLRIGAEINHTFDISPSPARCGSILNSSGQPLPCIGTARTGVSSITAGSFTGAYYFGEGRIQPYLVGGLSLLSAKEYRSVSSVLPDAVELKEYELSSTGWGLTVGAGLRASVSRHISIRPEIRFSDGTALSRLNLSQSRMSVGVAYGW